MAAPPPGTPGPVPGAPGAAGVSGAGASRGVTPGPAAPAAPGGPTAGVVRPGAAAAPPPPLGGADGGFHDAKTVSSAPPGPGAAAAAAGATPPAPPGLLATALSLWRELPGLVSDRVELFSLELKRAGAALAQIVVLVVAAAILGVTAWLVLWSVVAALLVHFGLPVFAALALVLLFNLLAAWLAVSRARKLLPRLSLPATRRHLTIAPSTQPRDHPPPDPTKTPPSGAAPSRPAAAGGAAPSAATS